MKAVDHTESLKGREDMGEERLRNRVAKWIADHMPRRWLYFAVIRVWAETTTGEWSSTVAPELTVSEALCRFGLD